MKGQSLQEYFFERVRKIISTSSDIQQPCVIAKVKRKGKKKETYWLSFLNQPSFESSLRVQDEHTV